ncbi:MAG: thiosulfate oxidation carrier protein SoxY [Rhodocyclaceae bacterium]|nr:thiosulfate oxidation carrier protein SoxY [Rhodocyclaceae bacterium]
MDQARRVALKAGGAWGVLSAFAALGLMTPAQATAARNDVAFDATSMVAALRALGVDAPTPSDQIEITAPEVAENGAMVRVAVASALPGTALVALLIDRNPNTLAALFRLPAGTEAAIETRVKMAESSALTAIVRAGGRFYVAHREVKVTVGGCG